MINSVATYISRYVGSDKILRLALLMWVLSGVCWMLGWITPAGLMTAAAGSVMTVWCILMDDALNESQGD